MTNASANDIETTKLTQATYDRLVAELEDLTTRGRVEIAQAIEPGAHAVLLVDQAGWHMSHRLIIPPNITVVPLPAKCPELNPVENIWQYMRGNWLSNRVFLSYTNILEHCCDAWNQLIAQPWTIMSVGIRDWAYRF